MPVRNLIRQAFLLKGKRSWKQNPSEMRSVCRHSTKTTKSIITDKIYSLFCSETATILKTDTTHREAQQKNQAEKVNKETLSQKETVSEKKQRKYDELIQAYWPYLKKHEGSINYAYLDTLGKVTAASGLYIPNQKTFISLPWMYQGKEATTEQKLGEYKRLLDFQKQKIFGKNYTSEDFRVTNHSQELTLSEHTIIDKTMEHLGNDLAELESKFPAFETYPRTLQMVLLDMQYNMGHNFNSEKWHFFFEGVNKKNVFQMINEVNRYQVGKTRNDWARNTLREIPLINGWFYSPCKYRNK